MFAAWFTKCALWFLLLFSCFHVQRAELWFLCWRFALYKCFIIILIILLLLLIIKSPTEVCYRKSDGVLFHASLRSYRSKAEVIPEVRRSYSTCRSEAAEVTARYCTGSQAKLFHVILRSRRGTSEALGNEKRAHRTLFSSMHCLRADRCRNISRRLPDTAGPFERYCCLN